MSINTLTLPTARPGFEIVAAIKMPTPMDAFTAFLKMGAKSYGKEARLIGTGPGWAFIEAPIAEEGQKLQGVTAETTKPG